MRDTWLVRDLGLLRTSGKALVAAGKEIRPVRLVRNAAEMDRARDGDVPAPELDREPVMKRAAAIVDNRGGRTSHAAISAREFGIPAVVRGREATRVPKDGQPVTFLRREARRPTHRALRPLLHRLERHAQFTVALDRAEEKAGRSA